jgi:hypothetical protein
MRSGTAKASILSTGLIVLLALPSLGATPGPLTVLVTSATEVVMSKSADGVATKIGPTVVGGVGSTASTYEHSEVWEVVRRLTEGCPSATFVTNPQTPHTLTIRTDYTKGHGPVAGGMVIYQLVLLDSSENPLYVSKKDWLHREIKPICAAIQKRQSARQEDSR